MDAPLNLVLFSGTDDRFNAAAVLAAGAAALGRPVNIFLQYWALDAFRADRIAARPWAGARGRRSRPPAVDALRAAGQASWAETLRQAKELGGVDIQACSLSMDLLHITETDLDPLVDGVEGVTAFYLNAGEGRSSSSEPREGATETTMTAPSTTADEIVDARGLSCPMPIVKTARPIKTLASGRARRGPGHRSRVGQGLRGLVAGRPATSWSSIRRGGSVYRFLLRKEVRNCHDHPDIARDRAAVCCPVEPLPASSARARGVEGRATKEFVIINWSGDLDKVWPTLILSSTAAASGMRSRSSSRSGACSRS